MAVVYLVFLVLSSATLWFIIHTRKPFSRNSLIGPTTTIQKPNHKQIPIGAVRLHLPWSSSSSSILCCGAKQSTLWKAYNRPILLETFCGSGAVKTQPGQTPGSRFQAHFQCAYCGAKGSTLDSHHRPRDDRIKIQATRSKCRAWILVVLIVLRIAICMTLEQKSLEMLWCWPGEMKSRVSSSPLRIHI